MIARVLVGAGLAYVALHCFLAAWREGDAGFTVFGVLFVLLAVLALTYRSEAATD